ncbi:MAG: Asp-tRNA(Asn)/Glu-tRNA(Gln) amidotransferase subunit GatC [Deltaproteobacteria bacterium]|nr:Asp-tRNA(Asn)/Glu-tRNA(Gln) amidotransferase subunit GatC [Deltaproteobacteria bacterium]
MPDAIITPEQVRHVARLARLSLDDDEVARMTKELGAILEYMARLDEADTSDVEPTAQVGTEALALRHDEPRVGLDREVVLGQGPSTSHDGFAVPAFVDE